MKVLGYVNKFNRGIARVKNELSENGNPDAVFDYDKIGVFGVTVYDALFDKNDDVETREKTREKIIVIIEKNKNITTKELAEYTGISTKGVEYHLRKLKEDDMLERIGGDKGGYWKIKGIQK